MKERSLRSQNPNGWIAGLVDEGSFESTGEVDGVEITAGLARVGGRTIALYAQDPSVGQGLVGSSGARKIARLMDRAHEQSIPIVALLCSPGVDVREGLESGAAYTEVIAKNIALSGVVPQIAVVMGVTMGAPAYSATLMDFVSFNRARSHLVVTGPTVVERMLGQQTSLGELGGSDTHARITGLAHFVDANIGAQLERVRWLLGFLPNSAEDAPPRVSPVAPEAALPEIPAQTSKPFDITKLVVALVDGSRFVEYLPAFGRAMVTAFAYVGGRPLGIVANQSHKSTGAIDADAAQKSARFIRLCDAYRIPILTLIDVPGFMPGVREEHRGLLRHGADLCAAMVTRVPRLSLVVRRCYGAAAFVMLQSRALGGDLALALDSARIAAMGFDAAKHMVYPERVANADAAELQALRSDYARDYESPAVALARGLIDEVVALEDVRTRLSRHLEQLEKKTLDPARINPLRP